ncbi:hypothetical protein I302_100244 [Kwoniella bestiolae CBS 10118]|uniref:Erythromycin biosynthesis protein CIII-like C-terminal domain-containing protein n=1 Tax=Kwoniella bestiolae CBS 10118 TaxID=1296100 RepID=A0A1B9G4L1_9TREE|nr:hypothetical protein I302_03618 [Kwoniella bestiolae CBS 10118]OCF25941.1 hypothetical protein I302_03618 [Kwoniella bestiolae CBS 10118]
MARATATQRNPTLLFITAPESGQANCNFAVISSLRAKYGEKVDIHLASYAHLAKRRSEIGEFGVNFHEIKGVSMTDGLMRHCGHDETKLFGFVRTPPHFYGSILSATRTTTYVQPDTPAEYVATAQDIERLIQEVDPDYILVDSMMSAARDAIRKTGRSKKTSVLTPNTAKEAALGEQGLGVFAIPAVCTGYPYPLPWYLLPANITITLFYGTWLFLLDRRHRQLNKARIAAGYTGVLPLFDQRTENTTLCMSTPHAEIPLIIPDWLVCCGPILQASKPLEEVDKKLCEWVRARPTVLISLGTNLKYSQKDASEMWKSVRILLGLRKDIQVLWKLKKLGDYELPSVDDDGVGDRLRIVDWLEVDPISILRSGNVICFVSHGGSNSYHEGLYAGVPQVILPAWADCYDFTARLKYFGIGAWGNPTASPGCSEPELTKALLQVVGRTPDDKAARVMREKAKEMGRVVSKDYTLEGRDVAADHIWGEMQKVRSRV